MNTQKPCFFINGGVNRVEESGSTLPPFINLSQLNITKNADTSNIHGEQANGVLTYYMNIPYDALGASIKIKEYFNNYSRSGISRKYLYEHMYVYEIADYSSQALSPHFTDFEVACFNNEGYKINHRYISILKSFTTNTAYILIDKKEIDRYNTNNFNKLSVRVSLKIKNDASYAYELQKIGNKYVYDFGNNINEISLLAANKNSYCFYANGIPLYNSFKRNILEISDNSNKEYGIMTEPQSGTMLGYSIEESEDAGATKLSYYAKDYKNKDQHMSCLHIEDKETLKMLIPKISSSIGNSNANNIFEGNKKEGIKFLFKEYDVPDYFRQLFDADASKDDLDLTPDTFDRYCIELTPDVTIGTDKVYIGSRLLGIPAFFYNDSTKYLFNNSNKKNTKVLSLIRDANTTGDKYKYADQSGNDIEIELFNSMTDFEVYKFDGEESLCGIKVPVEDDNLYIEVRDPISDSTFFNSIFFSDINIDTSIHYEIIPRYDNNLFYSATTTSSNDDRKAAIAHIKPYNYVDDTNNGIFCEYVFTNGRLNRSGETTIESSDTTTTEFCFHIFYDDKVVSVNE